MKKYVRLLFAALALSAGMLAPTGLSAQKRVFKVQGHPHELLTGEPVYINPDDVKCWIDEPGLNPYLEIDSACLLIKFTDGKQLDSLFVWGYRFNGSTPHHGIDMLRAVANNDRRLSVMLQYTGAKGHAVGAIGLNWTKDGTTCSRSDLMFDLDGAEADPDVRFVYPQGDSPDCADGQVATPLNAQNLANFATVDYMNTGLLEHPLGAEFGYPAYDFDYWNLYNEEPKERHWQTGWYRNGRWEYYRADNLRIPRPGAESCCDPDAARFSVTYEPLRNRQVHGFVFNTNFNVSDFDGTPVFADCSCAPCPATKLAPEGLSARQRVVKVQGHPHESLTRMAAEGKVRTAVTAEPADTVYINPADIACWIDEPGLDPKYEVDSAFLMIKWTDAKALDSLFVWGYRWNPLDSCGDSIPHHGIDMLRTVANNDRRLTVMLQYSGTFGHAAGGIGLNWANSGASCSRIELDFDIAGAQTSVDFSYFSPNEHCGEGQVAVPVSANNNVLMAKNNDRRTGVLVHPFSAKFGYSAYDFDYWNLGGYTPTTKHWQSGWVNKGFWGYFRADDRRVPIPSTDFDNDPDAAQFGVTYEPLRNQQVHGFVYEPSPAPGIYTVHPFDGTPVFVGCNCAPCAEESKGGKK
jgi:hypothetical protein